MMSNLGRHASRDLERELARAYDGEVPPPFYAQPVMRVHYAGARQHAGELGSVLPYTALPTQLMSTTQVSLDQLEEVLERRARREEHAGSS